MQSQIQQRSNKTDIKLEEYIFFLKSRNTDLTFQMETKRYLLFIVLDSSDLWSCN